MTRHTAITKIESDQRSRSVPELRSSCGRDPSGGLWAAAGRSSALPARAVRGPLAAFIVKDETVLPPFAAFRDAHGYYATYLQEAVHAIGAEHRLDRDFTGKRSKDALSMEETTAELCASFLLADLGTAHHPRADHPAYVASWPRVLKDEPRAIFTAAGKAQAAADWMHARQPPG